MSENRDIDQIEQDEVEQMIEEARRQGFLGEESISQVLGRIDGARESFPVELLADQLGLPDSTVSGLLDSIREHATAARKRKGDESGGSSSEISVGEMEILHSSTDLSSRYDHVCQINRGGMGEILRALDPHANREVAIKILPHERRDHLRACSKFLQEARLTAGLDHPNIVPIYEVGFSSEWGLYYSMKLVQGKTLAETLALCRPGGRLGVYGRGRALRDFLKVCEAMALAHSRGVIHRDLKPSNIMLGAFGEVVVMDWGLAKQIDTGRDSHESEILGPFGVSRDSVTSGSSSPYTTVEGAVMGTAAYMPPEQAAGQISEIDVRSDIYSLGAILYEILTLTPPFRGRDRNVLMDQVRSGKFDPPGERAPEERVPRELEAAVLKAMSRKKEERYAQVDALQADIEAFLEGRTLVAAEYTTWQRAIKWMSRNRMACVVGVGVFFFALFFQLAQIGLERWESEVRFREHVEEAHRYMKRTGSIEGLMAVGSGVGKRRTPLDTESPEKDLRRRLAMGNYLAAARELERALRIQPEVHSVRSERIELGVAIGRMALAGNEYLLARRAFEELEAYGFSPDRSRLWQERVRTARSALLEERARRLRFIIEDLDRGMARKDRPQDAPLLTDYVFESVTFRDRQTVGILGGLLKSLIRKKEGTPESLRAWTQNERDQATYACRVLGRLGFSEAVTPLSEWLDALSDPERFQPGLRDSAMAVEAGLALCNTRRPESLASLLRARARFGLNSPFWERILSRIGRVPVEGGLPDPTAADFFSRANLLLDQMRWDEAIEAFSRAIDRDPE
ncbi:MAG: protein kinase, partial [Planctomycetota bacterium]|nr:protein kinase [Planctomycetota bacterium]